MAKAGGRGSSRHAAGKRRPVKAKQPSAGKQRAVGKQRGTGQQQPAASSQNAPSSSANDAPDLTPRIFRLGAVPGATPGRWIDTWKERMPHVALELVPIEATSARDLLDDLDAALIRLPFDDGEFHVIRLYDEVPVVVTSVESSLLAADELSPEDLTGEVLVAPLDDVLGALDIEGLLAPSFAPVPTTADAVATVATGVGIAIMPMSLARLHHRKDADYRPLRDGPTSTVALVWPRKRSTADVDAFVGIVRGRTANSSR